MLFAPWYSRTVSHACSIGTRLAVWFPLSYPAKRGSTVECVVRPTFSLWSRTDEDAKLTAKKIMVVNPVDEFVEDFVGCLSAIAFHVDNGKCSVAVVVDFDALCGDDKTVLDQKHLELGLGGLHREV